MLFQGLQYQVHVKQGPTIVVLNELGPDQLKSLKNDRKIGKTYTVWLEEQTCEFPAA